MRLEVQSVGNFLAYLIQTSPNRKVKIAKLKNFTTNVVKILQNNFNHQWFLEDPWKKSGRRAIKINPRCGSLPLTQAAVQADIKEEHLYSSLPVYLCIWIDPLEVTYRIGEYGHIRRLYEQRNEGINTAWQPMDGHGRTVWWTIFLHLPPPPLLPPSPLLIPPHEM